MQQTIPYTPQQNFVTKRTNHTLKEVANYMIISKGISPHFFVKSINCANHIVSHTPTKDLNDITWEE